MNLVMCDKKCKHQEDGYCKVEGCSIHNTNEICPYYEAEKPSKESNITIEFPERKTIQEIPQIMPEIPIRSE